MPLDVDVAPGRLGRLLVRYTDDVSDDAKTAVNSLLSSQYSEKLCGVVISVEDFPILCKLFDDLKIADHGGMSDEAGELINKFILRRDNLLQIKKSPPDESILEKFDGWKTKPYPDQLQCLNFHIQRRRSLEAGETGIGKTLILLYSFLYWKALQKDIKGLILCINSGKLDWESEIEKHTNLSSLIVGNGSKDVIDDLRKFKRGKYDLLVTHYECLYQDARSKLKVFDYFKEIPFGFVALDEVHTLKNPQAKRHKRIMELVGSWGDIPLICATGTAIDGNPKSAWTPLKLVEHRPNCYFPSYNQFYKHFVVRQMKMFYRKRVMVEVGFKNLRRLKDYMEYSSIRFLKSEVSNRPSKIFQTRVVLLTGAQKELYEQIKKSVKEEVTTDQGNRISLQGIATKTLRLRQVINHPKLIHGVLHYAGDSAKYIELDNVIEEICSHSNSQVLVWTQWREAVNFLVQRYKSIGAVAYYGGSDDREVREKVLSKKVKVVIAIPEKAATSIDWLKVCRTAVYLEKPWYLPLYRQSLDRIDRRTNTDSALIISIEAASSVDQLVNAMLQRRQDIFDALTMEDEKLVALDKEELLQYLK